MLAVDLETLKKKTFASGAPGVFSLDQLRALGQTGNLRTDWMSGAKPDTAGMLAGGGRAMIDPGLNLPAGHYQIPGAAGAEYYDPHSGQVSQAFADWANSGKIERDPITNAPKALMDSRDAGDVFRAGNDQSPATIKTLNDIFAIGKTGGSYQDAQDRVLGTGRYQQFLSDKNGKQIRVADVPGMAAKDPATAPYTDTSAANKGGFDRLMKLTGQNRAELEKTLGGAVNANDAPIAPGMFEGQNIFAGTTDTKSSLEDALATNYTKRASMWKGLQEQRIAHGLDANTGTSDAEKKRIYDTVSRISDPAQRAAYISAQDTGNLTAELRAERYAGRAGERAQIGAYDAAHPQVEYNATGKYGQPEGMQVKLTSGGASFSDTATGRETFVGSVPKAIELVKPKYNRFDEGSHRVGGGVMGAMVGFATGGIPGAFLGGYTGAGGPTSKGSLNRPGDWGKSKSNSAHYMDLKEIGTAVAFAAFFKAGVYGRSTSGDAAQLSGASKGFVIGR